MSDRLPKESLPSHTAFDTVARVEWPTVALTLAIYGGFMLVTLFWQTLPVWLVMAAGGWLIAWHGSLQHEVIHGHPTRIRSINDAIGWPPLSLWLPYAIYRQGHLAHHRDEYLTDPIEDPESSYLTQSAWKSMGWSGRLLARWNTTLLGRLTLGPMVMIFNFLMQELVSILKGDKARTALWAKHSLGVACVLVWVLWICEMPVWLYLFGFVYVGAALSRLRSYAEHRYADHHDERTAIVENAGFFGVLFLFNNLHVLHHKRPGLPWYYFPRIYSQHRDSLIAINGGLVYSGYRDVARRFMFRAYDKPHHPIR